MESFRQNHIVFEHQPASQLGLDNRAVGNHMIDSIAGFSGPQIGADIKPLPDLRSNLLFKISSDEFEGDPELGKLTDDVSFSIFET